MVQRCHLTVLDYPAAPVLLSWKGWLASPDLAIGPCITPLKRVTFHDALFSVQPGARFKIVDRRLTIAGVVEANARRGTRRGQEDTFESL
jgi:hypothetical protein